MAKYVRSVSNGFLYALEACLANLELPYKLFICSDTLGELWSSAFLFLGLLYFYIKFFEIFFFIVMTIISRGAKVWNVSAAYLDVIVKCLYIMAVT